MIVALLILGFSLAIEEPKVEASYAGDRASSFVGRRVTVCGDLLRNEGDGETVLYSQSQEPGIVIASGPHNVQVSGRICISGITRRTDGLTQEEAFKRNQVVHSTHFKYDRQYYLSED